MFIRKIPTQHGCKHSYNYYYHAHYGKGVTAEEDIIKGAVFWSELPSWVEPEEEEYLEVLWVDQGMLGLKAISYNSKFQLSIQEFQRLLVNTYEQDLREVLETSLRHLRGPLNKRAFNMWGAQRNKILGILGHEHAH